MRIFPTVLSMWIANVALVEKIIFYIFQQFVACAFISFGRINMVENMLV